MSTMSIRRAVRAEIAIRLPGGAWLTLPFTADGVEVSGPPEGRPLDPGDIRIEVSDPPPWLARPAGAAARQRPPDEEFRQTIESEPWLSLAMYADWEEDRVGGPTQFSQGLKYLATNRRYPHITREGFHWGHMPDVHSGNEVYTAAHLLPVEGYLGCCLESTSSPDPAWSLKISVAKKYPTVWEAMKSAAMAVGERHLKFAP